MSKKKSPPRTVIKKLNIKAKQAEYRHVNRHRYVQEKKRVERVAKEAEAARFRIKSNVVANTQRYRQSPFES